MMFTTNNLPNDSQPWGREVEKRIEDLEANLAVASSNLNAANTQISSLLSQQGKLIGSTYANPLVITQRVVGSTVEDAVGSFTFASSGSGFVMNAGFESARGGVLSSNSKVSYIYFKMTNSAGVDTGIMSYAGPYIENTNVIPSGGASYTSESKSFYISAPADTYTIQIILGSSTVDTETFYNSGFFVNILPITNIQQ